MAVVEYKAVQSCAEASALLASSKIKARVLAGGTDLIIQTKGHQQEPVLAIDVKQIASMMSAHVDEQGLSLGAAMSCAEFTSRADIKALYPGLVEAAYLIGSTQVQGRASVGGNLCNASPAADTIPALIVNDAQCVIQSGSGSRTMAVADFVTGVASNALQTGELLERIVIAQPSAGTRDAYLRFIPRTEMDIAVAGAAVRISLDDLGICTAASVAIGAVATTAILVPAAAEALIGARFDGESMPEDALAKAADAARDIAKPISDRRATAVYRRHVVGVLVSRAANIAAARAQSARGVK